MKNRRNFFKKLLAGTTLALFQPFAGKSAPVGIKFNGALVHHVFFWLKDPDNPVVRKQFEKAVEELLRIETIKLSHTGVPASTEQRDVVDHTYTYSVMTFFDSREGQDIYQVHPLHIKFVEENSHLWSKVIVYDSIDIS
jgi:hypothetical protein